MVTNGTGSFGDNKEENTYANRTCDTALHPRTLRVRRNRRAGGRQGGGRERTQEVPGHLDVRVRRSGRQEATGRPATHAHESRRRGTEDTAGATGSGGRMADARHKRHV